MKRCPQCQREFADSYTFCDQDGSALTIVLPEMQARLTIHQPDGSTREITLPAKPFIIGKAPECDIVIQDGAISRRHSQIEKRADKVFIKDLNSLNGTFINELRIGEQDWELKDGDSLSVGRTKIGFSIAPLAEIESQTTAEDEIPRVTTIIASPVAPPTPAPSPIEPPGYPQPVPVPPEPDPRITALGIEAYETAPPAPVKTDIETDETVPPAPAKTDSAKFRVRQTGELEAVSEKPDEALIEKVQR
ncbi:MAG: FHA domain-containing protein, partial [Blastocatellia bacterium]